ncbi:TPA: hypothetical protein N0F65_001698 [Lagenidium giganteum]|uniref:UDP-3-O-acyl-N-acetylglucosamine deacetylase n=1 Tax=Lagenidium giganteum TaxID=4803 RepID=A0AAV2YMQ0_9STRA|nr:TPA: hypothetical protein N0F65_001698 [Lagenidium giganteum]
MSRWQRTLQRPLRFDGVGLHSGLRVRAEVKPSDVNTGIVFQVRRANGQLVDEARAHIAQIDASMAQLCSPLMGNRKRKEERLHVMTVEHIMAALVANRVTNASVELTPEVENADAPVSRIEVPIMDGSSRDFSQAIRDVGIKQQDASFKYLAIRKPVQVLMEDKAAWLLPMPAKLGDSFGAPTLHMSIQVNFAHKHLDSRRFDYTLGPCPEKNAQEFDREIAGARTFTFEEEVAWMRENGLALGGSLENAVVFKKSSDDDKSLAVDQRVLNPEGLRYPDEWVRHKMLDCIGDIGLAGYPLHGYFLATSPGHALTHELVRTLLRDASNYDILDME